MVIACSWWLPKFTKVKWLSHFSYRVYSVSLTIVRNVCIAGSGGAATDAATCGWYTIHQGGGDEAIPIEVTPAAAECAHTSMCPC